MKNKKGFTLIELLAVIVILAIIMVIATMQVNKTIKKAKQDSYEITAKELIKQIKGKIALGEEYRCFNGNHEPDVTEYSESLTSLFNGNYKNICNKYVYGKENEGRACKRDFGTNTCQKLYNLSDDYRMMVYYQPCTDSVYMFLDASSGNSKLKGITKTHNETLIEYLHQEDTSVALYSNYYKIRVTEDKKRGYKIGSNFIKKKNRNSKCIKDYSYECCINDYSYECQLKLNSDKAGEKNDKLKESGINKIVEEYDSKSYIGIENACKLLYGN